jgi:hypothetical protein
LPIFPIALGTGSALADSAGGLFDGASLFATGRWSIAAAAPTGQGITNAATAQRPSRLLFAKLTGRTLELLQEQAQTEEERRSDHGPRSH